MQFRYTILLSLPKFYQSFISTHNQSLRTPIIHRNLPKIQTPRASPDGAVEKKTIQQMGRPLDEPAESGKPRETNEKRFARIPTTKESWNAQQKKFPDSDGNPPVAFSHKKKEKQQTKKK